MGMYSKGEPDLFGSAHAAGVALASGALLCGALMFAAGSSAQTVDETDNSTADNSTADNATVEIVCESSSLWVNVDEPVDGESASGVSNLRGWALASTSVERVELHVDGQYRFDVPYGALRGDVANAFPANPGALNSGFSMAYNYSLLDAGEHEFTLRAYSPEGECKDAKVMTNVSRFANSFYPGASAFDLTESTVDISGDQIIIRGAQLGDTANDVTMSWRTSMQKFAVDNILTYEELPNVNGFWNVDFVFNGNVEGEPGSPVCSAGGTLTDQLQVSYSGSTVTIGTTTFNYTGKHPLFGYTFTGTQTENMVGGIRTTEWDLTLNDDVVSGTGLWSWTDGQNQCSGSTTVSGTKNAQAL